MTRRRRSYRSPYAAMAGLLSGLVTIMNAPRKFQARLDRCTLEQVKIERETLRLQKDEASIARENNAVLLQDLEIELKKLTIEEKKRGLGTGYDDIKPPFWDG